jgi:hypothetical protein
LNVEGVWKSRRVNVAFKRNVIGLPKGIRFVDTLQYPIEDDEVRDLLFRLSQRGYGRPRIMKRVLGASWGDTVVVNRRSGVASRVPDLSQLFSFDFSAPVPIDSVLDAFRLLSAVKYAEPPISILPCLEPNDEHYVSGKQWHLPKIDAPGAWDITTGSSNVRIAIIDIGEGSYNYCDHLDFLLPSGACKFVGGEEPLQPAWIHAGWVAGVAGAVTNNSIGVASLGWNTSLLRYHIPSESDYTQQTLIDHINDASDPAIGNADVINMSIATYFPGVHCPSHFQEVYEIIQTAIARGVVVVAAAGNNLQTCVPNFGAPYDMYPAIYPGVIAVSGTDPNDEFVEDLPFSSWNYGQSGNTPPPPISGEFARDFVDVAAPGRGAGEFDDIWTTWPPENQYGPVAGTSFSAPQVAALAALIISVNPELNPAQIEQHIEQTAEKVGQYQYDLAGC